MDASLGHVRLTGVCWLERIRAMTNKPFKRRGIRMMVIAGKGLILPLASCRSGFYPRCMCLPRALVQEVMGDSFCGFPKVCVSTEPPLGCLVTKQPEKTEPAFPLGPQTGQRCSCQQHEGNVYRAKASQACRKHPEGGGSKPGDPQLCVLWRWSPL